jgi:hypothetical protein
MGFQFSYVVDWKNQSRATQNDNAATDFSMLNEEVIKKSRTGKEIYVGSNRHP